MLIFAFSAIKALERVATDRSDDSGICMDYDREEARGRARHALQSVEVAARQDPSRVMIVPHHHRSKSGSTNDDEKVFDLVHQEMGGDQNVAGSGRAKRAVLVTDVKATRLKASQEKLPVPAIAAYMLTKFLASKRRRSSVLDVQPALNPFTSA